MNEPQEIVIPDLGDFSDIPIIEIFVAPGSRVSLDDSLMELESDKATIEVPAPFAGTVKEVRVSIGDKVSPGDSFMTICPEEDADTQIKPEPEPADELPGSPDTQSALSQSEPMNRANSQTTDSPSGASSPRAGPSIRKFARELGVNLQDVSGSGKLGRISVPDVQEFVRSKSASTAMPSDLPAWPDLDHKKYGPAEEIDQGRIQKISGANVTRNWNSIPHVTNFDKADITRLERFRKELNSEADLSGVKVKVTALTFMIKAAAIALREHPKFNVSFSSGKLFRKGYYHVGFAADTPNGLVIPVVRDCDQKGLLEIASELAELARLAREGKLKLDQMSGGCITVSSLGGIGGTGFTPIINAPEVAILGAGRADIEPVWNGSEFLPRLIQPLSLSWDHRAVDGAAAARFLSQISKLLSDAQRMAL